MKKIALITTCVLMTASAAFAQGKVNWNAISAAFVTAQTNGTTLSSFVGGGLPAAVGTVGATATTANGFYYELLYSAFDGTQAAQPRTLAELNVWRDSGLGGVNSTTAGRLAPVNPTTSVAVPWASGTTQSVMLVGWSANLGTTWTDVLASLNSGSYLELNDWAFFGVSNTGYISPGTDNPGVSVFGSVATAAGLPINSLNMQLYAVAPIPEPATVAFMALGGASLLLFRRRK